MASIALNLDSLKKSLNDEIDRIGEHPNDPDVRRMRELFVTSPSVFEKHDGDFGNVENTNIDELADQRLSLIRKLQSAFVSAWKTLPKDQRKLVVKTAPALTMCGLFATIAGPVAATPAVIMALGKLYGLDKKIKYIDALLKIEIGQKDN